MIGTVIAWGILTFAMALLALFVLHMFEDLA